MLEIPMSDPLVYSQTTVPGTFKKKLKFLKHFLIFFLIFNFKLIIKNKVLKMFFNSFLILKKYKQILNSNS
jgi:hypothetical protein